MTYTIVNGQPIKLKKGVMFRVFCCSCNLVHDYFATKDVEIYVYRNDYQTKIARRKRNVR